MVEVRQPGLPKGETIACFSLFGGLGAVDVLEAIKRSTCASSHLAELTPAQEISE